jgi:hypothetical protein
MATGIQGPQGFKGARGIQGATGWGAIGNETGPTGPTGPIGWFPNQAIISTSPVTLTENDVSTLYRATTGTQGQVDFNLNALPSGGFFVVTNQTNVSRTFGATGPQGGTINGASTLTLPRNTSVMLIRQGGPDLASSYLYSGIGYTGTVEMSGGGG